MRRAAEPVRRAAEPVRTHEGATGDVWIAGELPRVLPAGWVLLDGSQDGARYFHTAFQLMVILSGATEQDGRRWLHLSCSHQARIPTWRELREVKDVFIGRDRYAYQVLPPDAHYVNINPRVLHLWHCLDADPLPDFTQGGGTL